MHHSCEYTQRLFDARTNDRETQCDRKRRTRSPLNFKHAKKSDATAGEQKIACNESDSSCNVGKPLCECQKAGLQSVLKWSCASCERGLRKVGMRPEFPPAETYLTYIYICISADTMVVKKWCLLFHVFIFVYVFLSSSFLMLFSVDAANKYSEFC